jgi:hypothetical protein
MEKMVKTSHILLYEDELYLESKWYEKLDKIDINELEHIHCEVLHMLELIETIVHEIILINNLLILTNPNSLRVGNIFIKI